MFDFVAKILGYRAVYLLDYDGEVSKRWAKQTPFGLSCRRMMFVSKVLLLPDGTVIGASYVKAWKFADGA